MGPVPSIAVLGAGPAGLTSAMLLGRRKIPAVVLEAGGQVGGIAKTVEHHGFRFDLGGHRFYTKIPAVQRLWERALGDDFVVRPRLSRIYYRGEYFAYPLRAEDVVRRLGLAETLRCTASYLRALVRRNGRPVTFEDWVSARFGKRLYNAFFRDYTEKVWGVPGSEIRSEWAAQRIRNLSYWNALTSTLRIRRNHVVSLIEQFHYPILGPGQMWEAFAAEARAGGVEIVLGARATRIVHDGRRVTSVTADGPHGLVDYPVDGIVSSISLADLVSSLDPPPPSDVVEAARRLRYRDLIVVGLVSSEPEPFSDNWVYLHDPGIRAGRVQNFGAWSAGMTRPGFSCLGVEYFSFRGDDLWSLSDSDLVGLAQAELASIGLIDPSRVVDGIAIRVPSAYPMYVGDYEDAVATIRDHLATIGGLQTVGRNGLHRYNNQDHSMWTAILGTLNLLDDAGHDVWSVNADEIYLEEGPTFALVAEPDVRAPA
ncbi:MAG: NAD(P)/FAD-dependent oxidoreductase [Thermoleophilia bacterium]|nr:NAD(P)/FAD-dependent oxidoreductase [Thermoleophilia bacterium]